MIKKLKVNYKELIQHIELKTDYWVNRETTNCYAYALGFDIPESNIVENAYRLGTIGAIKDKFPEEMLLYYSKEERFLKDIKALKLFCEETNPDEIIKDNDKYSYFLVSYFENQSDFHFMRKSKLDNTWWHKRGWHKDPTNKDDLGNIILNPKEALLYDYDYIRTYKLGFKRR